MVAEREQTKSTITELRGEIAELRSLLKAGQPPSPAPPPPDGELAPAGQPDPEIDTLNKQVANSEGWINWCRNNPEGGDVPLENGAIRHLTAEETATQLERHAALLPELRAELRAEMRVNKRLAEVEQRDAALRAEVARRQSEVKAVTWVPELRDPASPATRMASVILQAHPELETNPKGPEILAVLVKGALALNLPLPGAPPVPVNGNPPAAPAAAPPFPAQSRLPGASPALPSGGSSAPGSSSLLARFAASGKPEDKLAWAKAALAGV